MVQRLHSDVTKTSNLKVILMAKSTFFTLKMMNIIFRVIFLGLCIKTFLLLYCYFVSMAINPLGAQNLNMGFELSNLYEYSIADYSIMVIILIILTGLKACIAYWAVKISSKMKTGKPFNGDINEMIIRISRITLWAGLVALLAILTANG